MSRKRLTTLILVDLVIMALLGFRLWQRYGELTPIPEPQASMPVAEPAPAPPPESSTTTVTALEPAPPPAVEPPAVTASTPSAPVPPTEPVAVRSPKPKPVKNSGFRRSMRFKYVDSKAKTVLLTGSFTQWKPQPLTKSADGSWSLVLSLAPGDYSYNFVVNGRTIRDPSQRRTDDQGRSLLTVNPPNS